jgi:hypothetical protein
MRARDVDRKMFHLGHYEVIAAQFKQALTPLSEAADFWHRREHVFDRDRVQLEKTRLQISALIDLALSMAKRLQMDNSDFDPVIFLTKCSPDPEQYPLSELWKGVNQAEMVSD